MGAQFSAQATQALGPCPGGHSVAGSLVPTFFLQTKNAFDFVTLPLFQDCFDGDNDKSNLPLPSPRDNYPTIAPRISGAVRRSDRRFRRKNEHFQNIAPHPVFSMCHTFPRRPCISPCNNCNFPREQQHPPFRFKRSRRTRQTPPGTRADTRHPIAHPPPVPTPAAAPRRPLRAQERPRQLRAVAGADTL
jgi:hypothetical protein